jgi:hypothetical protein
MSNQPFNNDTDQQTRRQILKDTYLSRTQADADLEAQGRFKKQSPTMIVGAQYPKQPANSLALNLRLDLRNSLANSVALPQLHFLVLKRMRRLGADYLHRLRIIRPVFFGEEFETPQITERLRCVINSEVIFRLANISSQPARS